MREKTQGMLKISDIMLKNETATPNPDLKYYPPNTLPYFHEL